MKNFCSFIDSCPSFYHLIENIRLTLRKKKFTEIKELSNLKEIPEKGFFIRNGTEIIGYKGLKRDAIAKGRAIQII